MEMPGRKWVHSDYRYGFNGKEKANEIADGNYDFGARFMDSRIGRWTTWDPLKQKYPSLSPYSFVANSPLMAIDPDGKKIVVVIGDKEYKVGRFNLFKPKIVRQVATALKYVAAGEVHAQVNRISELKNDKNNIIKIHIGEANITPTTSVTKNGKTEWDVYWNPNAETYLKEYDKNGNLKPTGESNSPAIGLYHELVHKFHMIFGRKDYDKRKAQGATDDGYDNLEERQTTQEVNKVAEKLGEPQAHNHRGEETNVGSGVKHFRSKEDAQRDNETIEKDFRPGGTFYKKEVEEPKKPQL